MRSLRRLLIVALAAVALGACATTKHPIGISGEPQRDSRLLGAWKSVGPGDGGAVYVFFFPRPFEPYILEALGVSPPHGRENNECAQLAQGCGEWGSYSITLGKAGEFRFLNARQWFNRDGKPVKTDGYTPVLYRIEGETLYLSFPDVPMISAAVVAGQLAGEIKGDSVLITAEPAALDAYMAQHAARLFKPADHSLRRVD